MFNLFFLPGDFLAGRIEKIGALFGVSGERLSGSAEMTDLYCF